MWEFQGFPFIFEIIGCLRVKIMKKGSKGVERNFVFLFELQPLDRDENEKANRLVNKKISFGLKLIIFSKLI